MKKAILFLALLLFVLVPAFSLEIEEALKEAAIQFADTLEQGTIIAIVGISSDSTDLSDFMLDELTMNFVRDKRLSVVDRSNLEAIKKEMNFQLSGEVDDLSIQAIGAKLGASTVISGSLKPLGTSYRIALRALNVTTAAVEDMYGTTIERNDTIDFYSGKKVVSSDGKLIDTTYTDYNFLQRLGISVINPIAGLGSFITGNWVDGLIVAGCEAVGALLVGPTDGVSYYILVLGGALYGIIRPWFYHKPEVKVSSYNGKFEGINIGLTSAPQKKGMALDLSYCFMY